MNKYRLICFLKFYGIVGGIDVIIQFEITCAGCVVIFDQPADKFSIQFNPELGTEVQRIVIHFYQFYISDIKFVIICFSDRIVVNIFENVIQFSKFSVTFKTV